MGPAATAIPFADLVEFPEEALLPPLDRSNVDENTFSADQRAWRRHGVVIKRGFLPDTLLDPYIARRAAYRRPGAADNLRGWPFGFACMIVPEMRDVALYPPLMDLLRNLVGEEMIFHLTLTRWDTTGRQWHQDDYLNPDFVDARISSMHDMRPCGSPWMISTPIPGRSNMYRGRIAGD